MTAAPGFTFGVRRIAARQGPCIRGRGFTMVEMLIVIGVILLLTALTLMVTTGFVRSSQVRETENTMRVLETALSEWELAAGRQITYGWPDTPVVDAIYDVDQEHIETQGAAPAFHFDDTVFELVGIIGRTRSARDIMANIDPEFLLELADPDDPTQSRNGVRDPWDKPFRVVFPGRLWVQSDTGVLVRDEDGTVRTLMEQRHGIAVDRRILLVCAGPDGTWGDLQLDEPDPNARDQNLLELAADNIYSYEPLRDLP